MDYDADAAESGWDFYPCAMFKDTLTSGTHMQLLMGRLARDQGTRSVWPLMELRVFQKGEGCHTQIKGHGLNYIYVCTSIYIYICSYS
jgi:hypothetical protein